LDGQEAMASQLLRGNQSTCILIGDVDETDAPTIMGGHGKGIPLSLVRIGEGTDDPHVQGLMAAVGLRQSGVILVRPDGVIAAVGSDLNTLATYWARLEEFA
jgi:hypothetical protein